LKGWHADSFTEENLTAHAMPLSVREVTSDIDGDLPTEKVKNLGGD
jgi:hypothetical protein